MKNTANRLLKQLLDGILQHDLIVIPKSENPSRIAENMDVYDFELSFEDMKNIDALNLNERTGKDPDNFSF